MAFVDRTGRHAITLSGSPIYYTSGGPGDAPYMHFLGGAYATINDAQNDFVFGTGDYLVSFDARILSGGNIAAGVPNAVFDQGLSLDSGRWAVLDNKMSGLGVLANMPYRQAPQTGWHRFRIERRSGVLYGYYDDVLMSGFPVADASDYWRPSGLLWIANYQLYRSELAITNIRIEKAGMLVLDIDSIERVESDNGMHPDDLLSRAVISSLFSWRRARDDDSIPAESRQGWWGDTFSPVSGDEWGSRLWLLTRENLTPDTLARAREYSLEALQWLIDDGVAARVEVDAEAVSQNAMGIAARIYRADGSPPVDIRFDDVWRFINA